MNREQILGILRHVLTAVGMIIAVKGYTDEATVTTIIGAIMTAVSGVWSIFDKSEGQTAKKVVKYQKKQETKKLEKN